jgi:alkaline phosphatase D
MHTSPTRAECLAALRGLLLSGLLLPGQGCTNEALGSDAGLDAPSASDVGVDAAANTPDVGTDAASTDVGNDAGPPPDRIVDACEEVALPAGSLGLTEVVGWPLLFATVRGEELVFRAPAVARPTLLSIGSTIVLVQPITDPTFDIAGLAADCGTFRHGVASGDPRADGVTLWTRWTPPDASTEGELSWVVATDPALSTVVASGTARALPDADWTVHVELGGLVPGTTYYYAFTDAGGERSVLGRTRTAPAAGVERVRLAVASCSSLFSGYFSAYRRIAERDAIDLVVHLGDYIYDFVDENERVRVPPGGEVEDLVDLASHRRRHALYLSDPDLRAARAAHPWAMLWDNHDIETDLPAYGGGVQAFREWNAIPAPAPGVEPEVLYRRLTLGDLVDLYLVDMYLFQGRDTLPGGAPSALGDAQYDWLTTSLSASTASWRLIGMQKVFAEFGPLSGWQDLPDARSQLIAFFASEGVVDSVFLSGDSHFSVVQDVVDVDPEAPYDPATGVGAIGGELLPTSISRGNFDEQLAPGSERTIAMLRASFLRSNPHQVDLELTSHGYGIVDVTADRVVGEIWYSPILAPSDVETFGLAYAQRRGQNRWDRTRLASPTPSE